MALNEEDGGRKKNCAPVTVTNDGQCKTRCVLFGQVLIVFAGEKE